MPGYNTQHIMFDSPELLVKYTCPACKLLLRDAVQTSCGHWLCKTCADEIITRESEPCCPRKECGEPFFDEHEKYYYFCDKFVRREILSFSVSCKFHSTGCEWKGRFGDLDEHVKICDYSTKCRICQKSFSTDELKSHITECSKTSFPLSTPSPQDISPKSQFQDPSFTVESADLRVKKKLDKVFDKSVSLVQADVIAAILKETRAKTNKEEAFQKEDQSLSSRIADLESNVERLEKLVRSKQAEFEDRVFRLSLIENSYHDGCMVWKIPQFKQRMNNAESGKYTSIFSLPFYTCRYGYKMCLRLYILGDGIGKGNYMSLFFVIMRGEFDNILQWPFTHRVTFKLINQGSGRDVVHTFQPDPMSSSFKKPKSDMNIAPGCPRFISHTDLKSGGYIMDDTIFIKCSVETENPNPI